MAENNTEVLTKEVGLKENITPTGRKLGVALVPGTTLYNIKYIDNKQGDVPQEYKGRFTSYFYAETALKKYIEQFWEMSEETSRKQKRTISLNQNQNAVS